MDTDRPASTGTAGVKEEPRPSSPEDLRIKMEARPIQEEPLSSTVGSGGGGGVGGSNGSANGAVPSQITYEKDNKTEIITASMWNSVQGKLGKAGAVTTPDG